MGRLKAFWDGLDARKRLIGGLAVLAVLAAFFGIARVASTPTMSLLYSGLDAAAAGEVVAALEARGAIYEVREQSIYVDDATRDRIRMALATEGLPAGGPAGYELLDGLSGFGTTSQMFDAAYWRAKEGELARTILASPNVRAARVHIANPVSAPFSRAPTGAASVTVTMARGALDPGQAQAIRYLVSSAVAGMAPEAVAVIDGARGVVLAGDEGASQAPSADDRQAALRANVERLLEARVGAGRAIVEVSVDAAMDSETIVERVIDPNSRVAVSSEVESSQENATGPAPGVTIASNLPDGDVEGGAEGTSRNATTSRERQNFEVSETKRERIVQPGQVRRISVAVMVDGVTTLGPDGQPEWTQRPQEELDALRNLVQTAVGFDPARGDTVTIESLQFSTLAGQGSLAEREAGGWVAQNGMRLVQVGVLGALVLAMIFFVLRPMLARRPADPLPELTGLAELTAAPAPAIAAIASDQAERREAEAPDPGANVGDRIASLRDVIAARTEDSAAILRAWIEAPEGDREPAQP